MTGFNLKDYGCTETETPPAGLIPGRITEMRRELFTVVTERGEVTAALKGSFYREVSGSAGKAEVRGDFPCVGDFVYLQYNDSGVSLIASVLPRRSKFSRSDFSGHAAGYVKTVLEQVVAANFDYVFIVSSLNQDFKVSRISRYLTQALASGGKPVVILTKADLADGTGGPLAAVRQATDAPVHALSSRTGEGLDALDQYLRPGVTVVFLGMSGVGKSSLLNALMRREVMSVKAIREDDSRGRHTTTHRQLFMLPSGAMVIDTPGMRELGLFDVEDVISEAYADVEEFFTRCRFADCRHKSEPGCAVTAALADGSLPRERWQRYLAQKRENRFVDDKAGYLQNKRAAGKSIAMRGKRLKPKSPR